MNVCPTTTVELQAASAKQNCTRIKVYHCLRNQNRQLTQKCIKPSWIQAGLCAEYNTIAERLDAKPCKTSQGICPQKAYLSNDVISYSACAPDQHKFVVVLTSTQSPSPVESNSPNLALLLPTIIVPLVSIIIISMLILIWILRRRKRDTHRRKQNDWNEGSTEEMELLGNNAEIKEYLKMEAEKLDFFIDDGKYVPVSVLNTVKKHIFALSNVVIIGEPGSGKTSLAWNLCKTFHGKRLGNKTCKIKVLQKDIQDMQMGKDTQGSQLEKYIQGMQVGEDERILLLLDNYLDSASTNAAKMKLDAFKNVFQDLLSNRRMTLILTMTNFDYKRISSILEETFTEIQMEMSTTDIENILKACNITLQENEQNKTLDKKQFAKALEYVWDEKQRIGFPLIASLATFHDKFLNEFSNFAEEPIEEICEMVWKLSKSGNSNDRNKFCTIIYAAFKGGRINSNFSNSEDQNLFNTIADFHKVKEAVPEIHSVLFRQKGDRLWEFHHESILRILLSQYGRKQPKFLVERCPLHVLLRYCTLKRENSDEKKLQVVIEKKDYIKILIKRILNDAVDIKCHIMWEDDHFRKKYDQEVTSKEAYSYA